ncbi:MAG TPA: flagellar M-ring protein FliF C-terminal domain-containing protein [Candidatus Baltobacteraceae bacterium]|nr:flagellar M-ring protein FliF C-terminal domain-containing protein [Candidatus Baltobacteraceae bacterium]
MHQLQPVLAGIRALPVSVRSAAIAAIVLLAGFALIAALLGHPDRVALFAAPLHTEQLSEVQDQLAAWNVPFTPSADNVIVDAARRNDLLLRLSLAGIPHAHVETTGEALANVGVLTPAAVIDAQTRSGLAGDIEVALRSVDGVDDAWVIVAPAQQAEFADESTHPATASVRLQLHPGAVLSRDAVAGIRRFVAASVAGLDAASVTILDDRGVALGDGTSADDPSSLQAALQSALDAALGGGVAIVRVHAEYTHATTEDRETQRSAAGADPIERAQSSESYDGGGKKYSKNDEHDERGTDTREWITHADPGALARVSTAIFVDSARAPDLAKVRELAAATVGYDPRRGDVLTVQAVAFHHGLVQKHDGWFLLYGAIVPLLPALAIVAGLLAFGRYLLPSVNAVIRAALEREGIARTTRSVAGYAPARVRGALANEPPHAAAAIISALPAATAAAVLELYPQHEREAIVKRMQRVHSSVIPSAEELLARHA